MFSEKLNCTELRYDFFWKNKMAAICGFFFVALNIALIECIKVYFWHFGYLCRFVMWDCDSTLKINSCR